MKVQTATIRLVQITSRPKADGTYPIVIRVQFNGRAEKYTSVSVPIKYWDAKNEYICNKYPSSNALNSLIIKQKQEIIQQKLEYERLNIPYTAKMLLEKPRPRPNSLIFKDLCNNMIKEKGLRYNTMMGYNQCMNLLSRYMGSELYTINDLSETCMQGFASWLSSECGYSDGSINASLAKVGSVWKYAISLGIVDELRHPFRKFKYWVKYRIGEKHRSVGREVMEMILNDFVTKVCIVDAINQCWQYRLREYRQLMKRSSLLFSEACVLLCYYMQGIAFCDLVRIRKENVRIISSDGEEYYLFTGLRRKKTNEIIKDIVVRRDNDTCVVFDCFIQSMDERDGWFLPVFQNSEKKYSYDSEKKMDICVAGCEIKLNSNIKELFRSLGLDDNGITYYCFRHTFASVYMSAEGANPVALATMMGRSVNGIFRYVKGISSIDDIIREREKMFGK